MKLSPVELKLTSTSFPARYNCVEARQLACKLPVPIISMETSVSKLNHLIVGGSLRVYALSISSSVSLGLKSQRRDSTERYNEACCSKVN
jgi:hypothetical protein